MVNQPVHEPSLSRWRRVLCLLFASSLLALTGCASFQSAPASQSDEAAPSVRDAAARVFSANDPTTAQTATAPDRLVLASIDVDIPVVELGWHRAQTNDGQIFSEWDVAEYAAGWHKNSILPGQSGNVVMSGHNNILGAVFRELDQLRKGDEAEVWYGGRKYMYYIDQILIVPEKHASQEQRKKNALWIGDFPDDRLTLVSCWPRNDNTHRIIVVARPVDERQATGR